MKITDVQAVVMRMPYVKRDLPLSTRPFRLFSVVKVMTDEGITGIGEAGGIPAVVKYIETTLKPWLIGKNPLSPVGLNAEMLRTFHNSGRGGINVVAMSGIEIALWDIAGKAANIPVYQLLGGLAHEKVRAYASMPRYTSYDEIAEVSGKLAQRDYQVIKLHSLDPKQVATARDTVGENVDIILDVNCAWETIDSIRMGHKFEPYNLYWYEEPVWPVDDYDGLAQVKAELKIPLAAGENEYTARGFLGLIEKRAVDYLQPSVFRVGGIWQEKTVFVLGAALGRKVVPNNWMIGPGQVATLHVEFSCPNAELVETVIEVPEVELFKNPITQPVKGYWLPPAGPGLGVELDEKVLAKYAV